MSNGTNLYGYGIAIDSNCRNVFLSCSVGRARFDLFHGLAAAGRGTSLRVEFQNHTSALLTFEKSDCHSNPFPAFRPNKLLKYPFYVFIVIHLFAKRKMNLRLRLYTIAHNFPNPRLITRFLPDYRGAPEAPGRLPRSSVPKYRRPSSHPSSHSAPASSLW